MTVIDDMNEPLAQKMIQDSLKDSNEWLQTSFETIDNQIEDLKKNPELLSYLATFVISLDGMGPLNKGYAMERLAEFLPSEEMKAEYAKNYKNEMTPEMKSILNQLRPGMYSDKDTKDSMIKFKDKKAGENGNGDKE